MPEPSSERLEQFCRDSWIIRFTWCKNRISSELINTWIHFGRLERFFSKIRPISSVESSDNKHVLERIGKNDALFIYSRGGL